MARIEMIRGTVKIIDSKGQSSFMQHGQSRSLNEGTTLMTGHSDNIEIAIASKNYIRLTPSSQIKIILINDDLVKIQVLNGDVLAKIKQLKNNPRFIFETAFGDVEMTGPKGTHSLIWTTPEQCGAGVGFGSIQVVLADLNQSVDVPSHHFITFDASQVSTPARNNNNIYSRINQVSNIGDSKSATSILEGSHRRSRSR